LRRGAQARVGGNFPAQSQHAQRFDAYPDHEHRHG
jgi:hypothetical protein